MGLVSIILLVMFVIVSLILMLVILLQDDQGEGIAGMFGGAGTTPLGSRSGNVLTRFTSILGALFLFGAFALGWVNRTPESSNLEARARVERLRQSESTDWWVEKVQPPVPQAAESEPAAPAGEAPTSLQR